MTVTRVQGNQVNSSGSGTSQAVTLSTGITQGNLVVAAVACGSNNTSITGPSGWTQAVLNQPAGGSATIETSIWYMVVSAGHAGETSWTWTFGASHTMYICIEEWSATNGWQASPLDQTVQGDTAGSPTTATTIVSGTTATTTQASELWIASLAYKGSAQSESSITSGWTKDLEATLASNNTMTMLYQVASSTGTAACQYTIGSAQFWAGCAATFMPVVVTTSSRTIPTSAVLQSQGLSRTIPTSAALQSLGLSRTIPTSGVLKSLGLARTIPTSGVIGITNSRTIPTSAVLTNSGSRTIPTSAVLQSLGLSRTIPTSAALKSLGLSRTIPTSGVLKSLGLARTIPTSAVLTVQITNGGITLYASGTGTASFSQFRATQYPDPSLSLSPVLPRLGTSSASWNATTPTNTSLTVKTSLDGVNWSTATSGNSITGLTGQVAPVIDVFTSDTSANYTSTNKSGGSTATVTYDTTNSRITMAGGSSAVYLNSTISDDDVELHADMDRSDAGGPVWRYVDSSNYYELGCYDDSSTGGFTNQLRLYKVASGTRSLLGTGSTISWPRATSGSSPYKTIKVAMLGAVITVYFDGTLVQTYTDGSPLAAGKVGLRNDGGTSRYYQLRIQQQGDFVAGTPEGDIVTADFAYTQVTMSTTDPSVTPQLADLTTSARSPQIETGALITQLHDPSDTIAEKFNDEFDSIAQTSANDTNGDFHWNIANDGSTTFASRHATKAPFCIYSTDLLYKPEVQPAFGADLYRNRQTIKNCLNTIQITDEQKIADGSASSWAMSYQLYSAPTITVQGVAKTVGIAGIDTGKDFYWTAGSNTISQDVSATPLTSGYIIKLTYVGQFKDIVTRDNLAEQTAQQTRENNLTTGIVEAIEDGKGMLVSNAISHADGLLARYSNPNPVEIKFTTLRAGLQTGMIQPYFVPEFSLNNRQLLIVNMSTTAMQINGDILYEYAVTASDGANLNNWIKALRG